VGYDYGNKDVKAKFDLFGKDLLELAVETMPPLKNQATVSAMVPVLKSKIRHAGFAVVHINSTNFEFVAAAELTSAKEAQNYEKLASVALSAELASSRPHKLVFAAGQPRSNDPFGGFGGGAAGMIGGPPPQGGGRLGGPPPVGGMIGGPPPQGNG